MISIHNFFNHQEIILINNFIYQIKNIRKIQKELKNKIINKKIEKTNCDNILKMKKYYNNLCRKINFIKNDIKILKFEKISEQLFYKHKIITENHIDSLNKDTLQIINEFDFGGTKYLYYKEKNDNSYQITTNIDYIKTLLKEGWIEKIYKGNYNIELTIKDLDKYCELVFDSKTMTFKKINILDIRTSREGLYRLTATTEKNGNKKIKNYIIRDIDDYYNIEDILIHENLHLKSIKLFSINEIIEESVCTSFEMSITKAPLYNKVNLKHITMGKSLYNTLYNKINKYMNK